jgi:hypothetical protein
LSSTPDLEAVDIGEHPVEDDQVGLEAVRGSDRLTPARRFANLVALVAQRGGQRVDDRRLVVHDEDAVAVRARDEAVSLHAAIVPALSVNRLRIS